MKKILGLDIGTASIGWAIVEATDEKKVNERTNEVAATDINNDRVGIHKDAVGVRIISQDTTNIQSFNEGKKLIQGSTLTPTANRRVKRGSRRLKSRYKLRRGKLDNVLSFLKIVRDEKYYTNEKGKRGDNNDIGKALYELRDRAIREKISLSEFGRILLHLNQWRGYSSDRFAIEEKPKFEYLTGSITYLSEKPIQIDYEKDDKTKINWLHYAIEIKLDDAYKIDEEKSISEINNARIIVKEESHLTKKQGDIIAFNFKEQDIKVKNKKVGSFNKISLTKVNPEDWNFKYQELQKTLTEWCNEGKTLGSYFFHNFYENKNIYRIRNNVVNRNWYEQEFDKIWDLQFENHKDFFEKINIEDVIKAKGVFKDYQAILNEVKKKDGIKEQLKCLIKDKIIFFQRPWQQAKNKGQCPFEKIKVKKEVTIKGTGKKEIVEVYVGRTIIPRSHPLFQEFKIWQQINNVRVYLTTSDDKIDLFSDAEAFKKNIGKDISEVKQLLFDALQNSKSKSWKSFAENELGLKKKEIVDEKTGEILKYPFSYNFNKRKKDGTYADIPLKGNTTKVSLQTILKDIVKENNWFYKTHSDKQKITNLQLLWEIIYDITNSDANKVAEIIEKHFGFEKEICLQLAKIKFDDVGMGNLSAKAIRHILPIMSNGDNITEKAKKKIASLIALNQSEEEKTKNKDEKLESLKNFITDKKARLRLSKFNSEKAYTYLNYWEATAVVYGSHSSKNTTIKSEISRVENHSMNNPVVEKIVNETILIVNEIYKQYGFDEVRIELSRELKASMDERQQMYEAMTANADKNEWAKEMLRELKSENANLDADPAKKSNIDKIRIIEDVVKHKISLLSKEKIKEFKLEEPSKTEVKKYLMWLEQNFLCPYTNQPIPLTDVFARGNVVEIEHIIPRERYYLNSYANKVITWREVNQAKADNGNRTAFEFIVNKEKGGKRTIDEIKLTSGKTVRLVSSDGWEEHVKNMFPKGAKRNNLLRKEIPEDPINRTLNETQYISKKLKEKLAELIGEQKVWVTSGAVTDILRERWHLNNIMKELLRNRFENFNTGEKKDKLNLIHWTKEYNSKTGEYQDVEKFEGFSKRLDHRHHAIDAIIIACTKQNHVQYINNLNAINTADLESDESKKEKYAFLKKDVCIGDSSKKFITPWNNDKFIVDVKNAMNEIVVSHKNTRLLISPSKNKFGHNKVASIRGELHKETNYAKKNYFEKDRTQIKKLIPNIIKLKKENKYQSMVHFKKFDEIIRETVLKEKYQNILIPLFEKYENEKLNDNASCKKISDSILKEIEDNKLLIETKTNKALEWLSTYAEKDKSVRPNGLTMNLNTEDILNEKTGIADPRIKRLAEYRLSYVIEKCNEIEKIKELDKKEKDKRKAEIKALPLYSNAIYEVRLKRKDYEERVKAYLDPYERIEIKNLNKNDIDRIEYTKKQQIDSVKTDLIKNKLKEVDFEKLKESYFDKPIFLSATPILIKKVRQKAWVGDMYEITKGRYVNSSDMFMTYFFKNRNDEKQTGKRECKFLKYLDAVRIISAEKPNKIDYTKLIEKEKTNAELLNDVKYDLLFTLSKNDLVYLPSKNEDIENIDWNNISSISRKLFIVKVIEASNKKVIFQQLYKADAINISEADAKSLFKNPELKQQTEEIKYGVIEMMQSCIKVFTDKLGKKIVPYWEFPNGCWNRKDAEGLGLIEKKYILTVSAT